ncbi:MAG: hypothetical protein ACWA5A_08110 [Marinibacterium sp.]
MSLCLAGILLALPATAGPWLRDPSLSFASFQITPRTDGAAELGIFAERGLTHRLTLGVDLNDNGTSGHALVFARLPIHRATWVASIDLALGGHRYRRDTGAMARVLAGLGRNIRIGEIPGWAALSVGPEWRQGNGGAAWKADATVGFKAARPVNPILSVETYLAPSGSFYWSVIPGITVRESRSRTWIFGLERRGGPGVNTLGLRAGLWVDF